MNAAPARPLAIGARIRTAWIARSRQERLVYQLLLPVFGTVFVLATIPFVLAVIRALTSEKGAFIGLDNFGRALGNPLLYEAIKQTAIYAAIALPIEILGGLGIALLVHRTVRSNVIRAAIYIAAMIPIVIPQIAVGVVFRLVYARPTTGSSTSCSARPGRPSHSGCRRRRWR